MTVINSLIPAPGRVGLLANSANRSHPAFNLLHLGGSKPKVAFLIGQNLERPLDLGLRRWLTDQDIPVTQVVFPTSKAASEIRQADIVIVPPVTESKITVFLRKNLNPEGAVLIRPMSFGNLRQGLKFSHFFDHEEMSRIVKALQACPSQLERVRFDEVKRNAARGLAFWENSSSKSPLWPFLERFDYSIMTARGQLRTISSYCDSYPLFFRKKNRGIGLAFSPHADDFPLGAGGFGLRLIKSGWKIFDLVLTSGYQAVSQSFLESRRKYRAALADYPEGHPQRPEIIKQLQTQIRTQELSASDQILGAASRMLNLGFYERRNPDNSRIILQDDIDAVQNGVDEFLKDDRLDLAFLPLEKDVHPDHQATRPIALEVLRKIAQKQKKPISLFSASLWYTGSFPVNALLYYPVKQTPRETFKIYLPATYYFGKALAEVGRELAFGFAQKPPEVSAYGEGKDVIAEGYCIEYPETKIS